MLQNKSQFLHSLSLLDRLTEAITAKIPVLKQQNSYEVTKIIANIRTNIINLLNTKQTCFNDIEGYNESGESILNYGISNYYHYHEAAKQKLFCQLLKKKIEIFEPRLKNVQIFYNDTNNDATSTVYFQIEALLQIEPTPKTIIFNSILEPNSHHYSISG